jgi:hypothetical protein
MKVEQVNLSKINIIELPQWEAVYAIFAKEMDSDKPTNCRFVGETDNLRERTQVLLSVDEQNIRLKEFMQSDKAKLMVYRLMPASKTEARLKMIKKWVRKYKPKYND